MIYGLLGPARPHGPPKCNQCLPVTAVPQRPAVSTSNARKAAAASLVLVAAQSLRRRRARTVSAAVPQEAVHSAFLSEVEDFETPWLAPCHGRLPSGLRGALLRNGLSRYTLPGGGRLCHLFDGYGFLTRWELDGTQNGARCRGRFVDSRASRAVRLGLDGRPPQMEFAEFGTSPGREEGGKDWLDGMRRSLVSGLTDNANVNMVQLTSAEGESSEPLWLALSESAAAQYSVDPLSLRTRRKEGKPSFPPPLLGPLLQTAHPLWCQELGGLVNVATQVLPSPRYVLTLTRNKHGSVHTETLAELPCAGAIPSWVHSFALAGDVLVLLEMPCYYDFGAITGMAPSAPYVCMRWAPAAATRAHVVPLRLPSDAVVHELPAFFFFHVAGAALVAGAVEVDVCAYDDASILPALSMDRILSGSQPLPDSSRLLRLTLPLERGSAQCTELCDAGALGHFADFPRRDGKLLFCVCAKGPTTLGNCLARVDTRTGAVVTWGSGEELMWEPELVGDSVIVGTHDREGASLVVLEAKTMEELVRFRPRWADGGPAVPFPLHGEWLPA